MMMMMMMTMTMIATDAGKDKDVNARATEVASMTTGVGSVLGSIIVLYPAVCLFVHLTSVWR